MKRSLFCFVFCLLFLQGFAIVRVSIADGIENNSLKKKIERNLSDMLSEINAAQTSRRNLNYKLFDITTTGRQSLSKLWESCSFKCIDEEIVETCVETNSVYQVRNIPLEVDFGDNRPFLRNEYIDAAINFNNRGEIMCISLSISKNLYMGVIQKNKHLQDLHCRQEMLDYIEQLYTSYYTKDNMFFRELYLDDGLNISGEVDSVYYDSSGMSRSIVINNNRDYLRQLKNAFSSRSWFKINFDEVEIVQHPVSGNFYGITIHHEYNSDTYCEKGYIFLLWDCIDENHPMIHASIRVQDMINGRAIRKNEIISLSDFDI